MVHDLSYSIIDRCSFAFVYFKIYRNILFASVSILFCGLFVPIFRTIKSMFFNLNRIHLLTRSSFTSSEMYNVHIDLYAPILLSHSNVRTNSLFDSYHPQKSIGLDRSFFRIYHMVASTSMKTSTWYHIIIQYRTVSSDWYHTVLKYINSFTSQVHD